jgi:hypothetical protein
MLLIGFGYVVAAVAFYALISKLAPIRDEPVWNMTAPPRSTQVVELYHQSEHRLAA